MNSFVLPWRPIIYVAITIIVAVTLLATYRHYFPLAPGECRDTPEAMICAPADHPTSEI